MSEWKAFCYGYCDKIGKYFSESSNSSGSSNDIVREAINLHKQLRAYTYSQAGKSIPFNIQNNSTIDCSSFVSYVLYNARI